MSRLPNLNAIRAFEAAARLGSFARAAEELGVSHAAVSRHVRNLEAELGAALFERHARHVALTGEGALFAKTAAESLAALELGASRLRRGGGRSTVVLDVDEDLATRWLSTRLSEQALERMGVHLDIRCRPDPPRTAIGDADLAITWGAVSVVGYKPLPFLEIEPFAVCAPSLLESGPPPPDPAFFLGHRLIHERGIYWWRSYLDLIGARLEEARGHLYFNRSHLCMRAAAKGLGIGIGDDVLCRDLLESGDLVRLPGPAVKPRDRFYLLVPDVTALSQPVRRVIDWLTAEAEEHNRMMKQDGENAR